MSSTISVSTVDSSPPKDLGNMAFPQKLRLLLLQTDERGETNIISWLPDGKSFKIHKKNKFERLLMPELFNTSKFRSFQQNLNLWGFETVSKGPQKGVQYTHFS